MADDKTKIAEEQQHEKLNSRGYRLAVSSSHYLRDSNKKCDLIDETIQKTNNLCELSKTLTLHDFENEIVKYPEGDIFMQTSNDLRLRKDSSSSCYLDELNLKDPSEGKIIYRKKQTEENLIKKMPSIKYKGIVASNEKVKQLASKSTYQLIAFILIAVSIVAVSLVAIYGYNIYLSDEKIRKFEKKVCPFNKLIKKYPLEEQSLWMSLKYEIEDVINTKNLGGPIIYLLLRNENLLTNYIVKDIADLSASCFEENLKSIILTEKNFKFNMGWNIPDKITNSYEDRGAMVILINLNEISGKEAEILNVVFENKIGSKKLVVFLSLVVSSGFQGQTTEQLLRTLFEQSLTKNKLDLLISLISKKTFRLQS